VLALVELVGDGAGGTGDAVAEAVLAGNVTLGLLLVGLLLSLSGLALNGLRDVVDSVGDGVGGLAEDSLVGLVDVGGRHFVGSVGVV